MTIPLPLAAAVVATLNMVAFATQGLDKARARRHAWRIPEATLLALGLPLAAPGMWLGMKVFHHKTRKAGFIARAVLVTVVNTGLVAAAVWAVQAGYLRL